jgi:hypothetical protein
LRGGIVTVSGDSESFVEVAPWHWQALDAVGAAHTWTAIAVFVAWLVARYDLGDVVPRCWWTHGALVEELTALWAAWSAAYVDPDASADAPILWHERFAASRARLAEWDRLGCAQRGHRESTSTDWAHEAGAFDEFVRADLRSRSGAGRLAVATEVESPC